MRNKCVSLNFINKFEWYKSNFDEQYVSVQVCADYYDNFIKFAQILIILCNII
jgi:hypothetical protein